MMKIKNLISPTSSSISRVMNQNRYSAMLEIDIENRQDTKNVEKELNKFISNDLSKHSIIVLKHQ